MFLLGKTYDIDELVMNNMHTHSIYSTCAKREMELEAMVKAAEEAGLKTIAVTDHSDPGADIDVIANTRFYKEKIKSIDTPVRVLIGSELSAYGIGKYADGDDLNAELEYRNYSFTHYHLRTWDQPEDRSPYGYAKHMLKVAESITDLHRADSFAHPFSPCKLEFFNDEQKREVLSYITDNELGDVMQKAEADEISWELHQGTVAFCPEFARRFFNIGREVGVHFCVGTDAHSLKNMSTKEMAEILRKTLK